MSSRDRSARGRRADPASEVGSARRLAFPKWVSGVRSLGEVLRQARDVDEALDAVVRSAAEGTASVQATARLLGPRGERLLVGRRAGPPVHGRGGGRFGASEGFLGWVLAHGRVAYTNDPPRDRRFVVHARQTWMPTGVIAGPLLGREGPIGTLSAARRDGRPYRAADAARLGLIAEVASAHLDAARLARLAVTDDLTLLPNPRHLKTALPAAVARAERAREPLSVILLDLDHFGRVNNQYGYDVGDAVLREAADRLRGACRETDVAARKGGEEFLVLLPGTSTLAARRVAERIRRRLAATPVASRAGPISVTGSLGVAALERGEAGPAMLRRVDHAVKMAKRRGRNRTVCWSHAVEHAWQSSRKR